MSIWASIPGEDPVIFDAEYGDNVIPEGWFDVAVSAYGKKVRLVFFDDGFHTQLSLDVTGMQELMRRLRLAYNQIVDKDQRDADPS